MSVDIKRSKAVNNLYYPLAFMFSVAKAPASGRVDNVTTVTPETGKPGELLSCEFCIADINADSIDLGWQPVNPLMDEQLSPDQKFAVCLFGPLSFSYGDAAADMDIYEIKLNYCIKDRRITIDLDMIRAEILCMIESRYGKPVIDFSFGTVSAKVKALFPKNTDGKSPRENRFSKPHDFGVVIDWPVVEAVSVSPETL